MMCCMSIFVVWIQILVLQDHQLSFLFNSFCLCFLCFRISNSFKVFLHCSIPFSIILFKGLLSVFNVCWIRKFLSKLLFKLTTQIIDHRE
ncbi:hypothetical protein Hanom_Chr07g00605951 [Helianthus anomalus]